MTKTMINLEEVEPIIMQAIMAYFNTRLAVTKVWKTWIVQVDSVGMAKATTLDQLCSTMGLADQVK